MEKTPKCDMENDCANAVAYLDEKGYVYCTAHGLRRRADGIRCRKLTPAELRRLQCGETLPRY